MLNEQTRFTVALGATRKSADQVLRQYLPTCAAVQRGRPRKLKCFSTCNKIRTYTHSPGGLSSIIGLEIIVKSIFKSNLNNNITRIVCQSSCCVPKVSQINGAQGEATNTDDLKKTDQRQNRRLKQLEDRINRLSLSAKKSKPNKKKNSRPKVRKSGSNPFPGIPSPSEMDVQPTIVARDPTVTSVVSQIAPFRVPRGVANILQKTLPSQKFTARGLLSYTPGANTETIMCITPCIASDSNGKSAFLFTGTRAALAGQLFSANTLAASVSHRTATTNTPYTLAVLGGGDYQWRLVSCGVRIRNTTAAVSRQGVIKTILDNKYTLFDYTNGNTTYSDVCNAIDANHRVVRRNMATHPEQDLVISGQLFNYNVDWRSTGSVTYAGAMDSDIWPLGTRLSGSNVAAIGSGSFAIGPAWILFPSTPIDQSYDVEIVEHWEIHGSAIETLHTPSGGHIASSDLVHSIVAQAHHQHGLTPSLALHDVAKGVAFAEHHKAALKDCASVAAAIAML